MKQIHERDKVILYNINSTPQLWAARWDWIYLLAQLPAGLNACLYEGLRWICGVNQIICLWLMKLYLGGECVPLDYSRTRDRKSSMKRDLAADQRERENHTHTGSEWVREREKERNFAAVPFLFYLRLQFWLYSSFPQSVSVSTVLNVWERSEDFALFSLTGVL
jgi:hypothetical protein